MIKFVGNSLFIKYVCFILVAYEKRYFLLKKICWRIFLKIIIFWRPNQTGVTASLTP